MGLTIPISTIWGTQKEVLENDNYPVPKYNLAPEDRFVEGWHFAGSLTIVVRQAEIDDEADRPQKESDWSTYCSTAMVSKTSIIETNISILYALHPPGVGDAALHIHNSRVSSFSQS